MSRWMWTMPLRRRFRQFQDLWRNFRPWSPGPWDSRKSSDPDEQTPPPPVSPPDAPPKPAGSMRNLWGGAVLLLLLLVLIWAVLAANLSRKEMTIAVLVLAGALFLLSIFFRPWIGMVLAFLVLALLVAAVVVPPVLIEILLSPPVFVSVALVLMLLILLKYSNTSWVRTITAGWIIWTILTGLALLIFLAPLV